MQKDKYDILLVKIYVIDEIYDNILNRRLRLVLLSCHQYDYNRVSCQVMFVLVTVLRYCLFYSGLLFGKVIHVLSAILIDR